MLKRVLATISSRNLLRPGMHVLTGISGGLDSMVLLHMLHALRGDIDVKLSALHVHHGLRGREADRDAKLVESTCARLSIPFYLKRVDVDSRRETGISLEMAARQVRLQAFRDICRDIEADVVVTAHHRDDQIETVLMRLLTGSGMEGLAGMDYRSEPLPGLQIERPLLDVSRTELEDYAKRQSLVWREDSSNRDTAITRNRIRKVILPFLAKQGFAGAGDALIRMAELMREENRLLEGLAQDWLKSCRAGHRLRRKSLLAFPVAAQRRVLRIWLEGKGMAGRKLDFTRLEAIRLAIVESSSGKKTLAPQKSLVWGRGWVTLEGDRQSLATPEMPADKLSVPGVTDIEEAGVRVEVTACKGFKRLVTPPGKYPAVSYLKRTDEMPDLFVRSRKPGDRISPAGMTGSMSLKELFINLKIPAHQRSSIPLVVSDGQIICVPGYRVDRGWQVPDAKSPSWRIKLSRLG